MPQVSRRPPQNFPTPQAAADAVIAALEAKDRDKLLAIFGPESEDVIFTGDDAEDRENWGEFLRDYKAMHEIDDRRRRHHGDAVDRPDLWPFPASIVKDDAGWHFDAAERARGGAAAPDRPERARRDRPAARLRPRPGGLPRRGPGRRRAAAPSPTRSSATRGKRDGLYWPTSPGAPESPIGDFMARAAADGYNFDGTDQEPEPYLGYYYRVLTKQGPHAPGGAIDYMVDGHMVAGHALIAFPADYGDTGVMSFMVGENDVVYEADLGEDTLDVAAAIDSFDPGDGWAPVRRRTTRSSRRGSARSRRRAPRAHTGFET